MQERLRNKQIDIVRIDDITFVKLEGNYESDKNTILTAITLEHGDGEKNRLECNVSILSDVFLKMQNTVFNQFDYVMINNLSSILAAIHRGK